MGQSLFQRSFAGGELAPVLHARADVAKFTTGARTVKNFVVRREGGVSNRPGFRFIATCKAATVGVKLMRFVSSVANQSVLVEMGNGYFRFYNGKAPITVTGVAAWNGATPYVQGDLVVSGGVNYYCLLAHTNHVPPNGTYWYALTGAIYEIPTPYALANLPSWNQSGNVVTLTHPNVAPMELTFVSLTRWMLTPVSTTAKIQPPTSLTTPDASNYAPMWNAATAYIVNDLVNLGGLLYKCILGHTNHTPPNGTYWTLLGPASVLPWMAGFTYAVDAVVYDKGIAYTCVLGNTNQEPPNGTYWSVNDTLNPAWNSATAYAAGVGVLLNHVNYQCLVPNTNTPPPNPQYWAVVLGLSYGYIVTANDPVTLEESARSVPFIIPATIPPSASGPHQLQWTAPAGGADSYNVYCDPYGNGIYGLIGEAPAAAVSFRNPGLTPDFLQVPPIVKVLFAGANDYPSVSAYFQQRRFFANTFNKPDGVFGSRSGFGSNFAISSPLQDDDAITFRLAGNNHHPVRHMVALANGLVLMTDGGEWAVTGGGGPKTPVTPSSLNADQDTYIGCAASVRPAVVGSAILYVQTRGSILRELQFQFETQGLAGKDLTVFATHLFEGKTIVACDYQQVPDSIIWCVRNDGVLLGLTYVPEQDVWGWHRHETWNNTTLDTIEDVCVVPETAEDGVYVIVARTINGSVTRTIERLNSRIVTTFNTDCFFVDAGLSYHGAPAQIFSGLGHLEGQVVAVLADGVVIHDGDPAGANAAAFKVTAGKITLPTGTLAIDCHIGLAIRYPDLELLDLDIAGSNVRDKQKAVHSVTVLLDKSSRSFWAGPDADSLAQFAPEAWESQAAQDSGQFELRIVTTWAKTGRTLFRQKNPLPLTIIGVLPNVDVGG